MPRHRPWHLFVLRRFGVLMLLLRCRLESAETERHRGLDEATSPFTSRAARNVGGQCSSCRFASPPPAQALPHFRFRTRAHTAAPTGLLRAYGQCTVMPGECRASFRASARNKHSTTVWLQMRDGFSRKRPLFTITFSRNRPSTPFPLQTRFIPSCPT